MKKTSMIAICILLFLTACASSSETVLKNEKGETKYCYQTADHLGRTYADGSYSQCLNEAGKTGYKKVK